MNAPIVLSIAGSDSSGGAGIYADLKTFDHFDVHGCGIITAMTAQNNRDISHIEHVANDFISAQIDSLRSDFNPLAVKIGMLGTAAIQTIIQFLQSYSGYVVFDPVLQSSSNKNLFNTSLDNHLTQIKNIFPLLDVMTPNISEAETLLNCQLKSCDDIENAAKEFLALGVKSIFIKGGHIADENFSQDYWTNGIDAFWLAGKRYPQLNYRGTGCTLSSAITALLGRGFDIKDALVIAKMYTTSGIRLAKKMQHQSALLNPVMQFKEIDLPYLSAHPITQAAEKFCDCGTEPLGLYPIIDSMDWLQKLLPLGVKTIQLRIKNKTGLALENEIKNSIHLAQKYHARLFINDYWELALRYKAYGVHLGQEDLNTANITELRQAKLRLGISTHCYAEIARAHVFNPSYIALGPIYATTSKIMPFAPLGISQLITLRQTLNYPLIAIGGINKENIHDVMQTKVDGIAMISAITKACDPITVTKQFLKWVNPYVTDIQ